MKRTALLMTASLMLLSGCDWFGCCKKESGMPEAPQTQPTEEGYTHREQPSDAPMGAEEHITMCNDCPTK